MSEGASLGNLNECLNSINANEVSEEKVRWRQIEVSEAEGLVANGSRGVSSLISPSSVTLFDMEDDDEEEDDEEEEDVDDEEV